MFTFSFVALFALSVLSLALTVIRRNDPESHVTREKFASGFPFLLLMMTLTVILAVKSNFEYRYVVLGLMIASYLIDLIYVERMLQLTLKGTSKTSMPRRRFWWPLFDNVAWIAATCVLFYS